MVSELLLTESLVGQKSKEKSVTKSSDSGHHSGQSSLHTGDYLGLIPILISTMFQGASSEQ